MTAAGPAETKVQRKAREAAERVEWDQLIGRLRVLWPTYDCFCGTLDDLRRTVADLERRAARDHSARATADGSPARRNDDPAVAAKLATSRATLRLAGHADEGQARPFAVASGHAPEVSQAGADDAD